MSFEHYKKMVKEMVQERDGLEFHELESVRFTATLPSENLAVIDAIAETFNKTRTQLVADILNEAALGLFVCLKSPDLDKVAEIADEKHHAHCEKVYTEYNHSGLSKWQSYAASVKESEKNADS